MGQRYCQITIEERCEIARLQAVGSSIRKVAAILDRAPSTIARELKRNRSQKGIYKPSYAHEKAWARRWSGSKLDRNSALRELVLSRLKAGWSPESASGGPDGLPERREGVSFLTRPSTGSSTPNSPAPGTTTGVSICRVASQSAAIAAAEGEARPRSSAIAGRSQSGPKRPMTASHRGTGRPI